MKVGRQQKNLCMKYKTVFKEHETIKPPLAVKKKRGKKPLTAVKKLFFALQKIKLPH